MTIFYVIMAIIVTIALYHATYTPKATAKRNQEKLFELEKENEILRVRQMSSEQLRLYVNSSTIFSKYHKNSIKYYGMKEAQRIYAEQGRHIDVLEIDSIGNVIKKNGVFIVLNFNKEEVGRKEIEPMERVLGFGIEKMLIKKNNLISKYDANFKLLGKIELKNEEHYLEYKLDVNGNFVLFIKSENGNIVEKHL